MQKNELLRWLLLPFVAVTVFFVAAILGAFFAALLGVWYEPLVGFLAAFFVVMATSLAAPRFDEAVAIITFFLGAVVAWFLVGKSYFPESYAKAYEATFIPLIVTYLGGFSAVLLCFYLKRKMLNTSR